MNHKTDMEAPTEIYVWFADNKGTERDGERFIRAWTMDPVRADGLRGAIGRAPAVYRTIEASQSAGVTDEPKRGTDAQADERGALMCERLRSMGLNTANEAADLIEQMGRATAPQAEAAQGVPEGWTRNHEADSALIMLDRLDVSSDDDVRVDAIFAIVRKLVAAPSAHAAVAGELIYQVRAETWGRQWSDVPKSIFDKKAALEGWKVRIVYTIPQALAAAPAPVSEPHAICQTCNGNGMIGGPSYYAPDEGGEPCPDCCDTPSYCSSVRRCTAQDVSPSRECGEPPAENAGVRNKIAAALHYPDHWDTAAYPTLDDAAWEAIAAAKLTCSECAEQPSERGEQDCPHGVDDGACKQCYGEAVRGVQGAQYSLSEYIGGWWVEELRQLWGARPKVITDDMRRAAKVACNLHDMIAASAPTLGEQHTDEHAAFEAWWNANETWPVAAKNLAFLAWTIRAAQQPQVAEPKWLTEKQRDAIEHAIPVLMDAKQFGDVVTLRALLEKNGGGNDK